MHSIKEIFVIGNGPSSSHTIGPTKAIQYMLNKYPNVSNVKVFLYGSLAETGKGHLTDYAIDLVLKNIPHEIVFDMKKKVKHPNTMLVEVISNKKKYKEYIVSIGGGSIQTVDNTKNPIKETYPHRYMSEILKYCDDNNLTLYDYVRKFDEGVDEHISKCIDVWRDTVYKSVAKEGELPGELHVKRKAKIMYERLMAQPDPRDKSNYDLITATVATAIAEENASGGMMVTAPTCGSAGVIPGVLGYLSARGNKKEEIVNGLLVAGLIGQIAKTNATVAGAEGGCQAEIGVACTMAAGLIACAKGYPNEKIAQSAEIAMEHSLGLTCDPVGGYVIIPCIERNAMYALKARAAVILARLIPSETTLISFDDSIKTMYQTGKDLKKGYKETSEKGLAKLFKNNVKINDNHC